MRLSQAVAPAAFHDASGALPSAGGGGTGTSHVPSFVTLRGIVRPGRRVPAHATRRFLFAVELHFTGETS